MFVHWEMWPSITPLFDLTDEEETEANVAASDSEEGGEERAQPVVEEEEEGERGCNMKKVASGAQVGARYEASRNEATMRRALSDLALSGQQKKGLVFVRLPL